MRGLLSAATTEEIHFRRSVNLLCLQTMGAHNRNLLFSYCMYAWLPTTLPSVPMEESCFVGLAEMQHATNRATPLVREKLNLAFVACDVPFRNSPCTRCKVTPPQPANELI